MALKNYDPSKIVIAFKGIRLTGFAEGSFVSIARNEDGFTLHVGSDGMPTRAKNRNKSGTVTVTLVQSAPINDQLSAFALADELTGLATGDLIIKDLLGTTLAESAEAWIKKLPDSDFAKEVQSRAWVFECAVLNHNVGGAVL